MTEAAHQLAYAERQFEAWTLRVSQAQIAARLATIKGDIGDAARQLDAAKNWLRHLEECNDTIDRLRRIVHPVEGA